MVEPLQFPEEAIKPSIDTSWAVCGNSETKKNLVTSIFLDFEQLEDFNYKLQDKYQEIKNKEVEFEEMCIRDSIVTVKPRIDEGKPHTNSHPGQEFNYLINGSLKIYIHDNEINLEEGDSIFFDSSYEHAMEALNGKKAKFLAIIL